MALAGLKAMLAGVLRDRLATVGVLLAAGVLLATAWVLAVVALVAFLTTWLGRVGALLAVAAGLALLAVLIVWILRARVRRTAELRATTRALWAATAVNAASAILRGESQGREGEAAGSHRSALLVAGGLALMLLAFLLAGGTDKEPGGTDGPPGPGPDGAA